MSYLDQYKSLYTSARGPEGTLNAVLIFVLNFQKLQIRPLPDAPVWATDYLIWGDSILEGVGDTAEEAALHLLRQIDAHPATIHPVVPEPKTIYDTIRENAES